jgi:hypothetical protein
MKKIPYKFFTLSGLTILFGSYLKAQSPTDAIMMEKGKVCLAAIYSHDTWGEYWEGTLKRSNGNIGTLTRQTVMPMFALGIANRINFLAALPWVKTKASAGQVNGASGLQDWGFWLKGAALDWKAGPGKLTAHAVAGLTGPVTNYLPDFMPFSLGLGCLEGSLRGVLQYQLDKGLYTRGLAGYHLRGHSEIERDYYYTTHGVYSNQVDMPNAVTYGATIGSWLIKNSLKIEVTFDGLKTLGGFDIRREDAGFPSNKMNFTRLGGLIQYYPPLGKGLGVLVSGGQVLSGRNVGQSRVISGGITYQFGIWK